MLTPNGLVNADIAINEALARVYVSLPGSNEVRVLIDAENHCTQTIKQREDGVIIFSKGIN